MSAAKTFAPRSAKLCAMARPKPWPAPLTATTLPSKRMFMGGISSSRLSSVIGRLPCLDLVDHGDEPARRRAGDAVARADFGDRRDLHVDLGAALADGEVAPDAGMRLRAGAVELHHCATHGRAPRLPAAFGHEGGGVEAVEALRLARPRPAPPPIASRPSARQTGSNSGRARQSAMPFCRAPGRTASRRSRACPTDSPRCCRW